MTEEERLKNCARAKRHYENNREKKLAYQKQYPIDNKDLVKKQHHLYYLKNKSTIAAKTVLWQKAHPEKVKLYRKNMREYMKAYLKWYGPKWSKENRAKRRAIEIRYKNNHPEKYRLTVNKRHHRNYKNSVVYKLRMLLRGRLKKAIKRGYKNGSAVKDMGCTVPELKLHIESKFKEGMTWDNWSLHGWHIDHIKPLSLFDLSDRKALLKACHYSNLQPMWCKENWVKGNRI